MANGTLSSRKISSHMFEAANITTIRHEDLFAQIQVQPALYTRLRSILDLFDFTPSRQQSFWHVRRAVELALFGAAPSGRSTAQRASNTVLHIVSSSIPTHCCSHLSCASLFALKLSHSWDKYMSAMSFVGIVVHIALHVSGNVTSRLKIMPSDEIRGAKLYMKRSGAMPWQKEFGNMP